MLFIDVFLYYRENKRLLLNIIKKHVQNSHTTFKQINNNLNLTAAIQTREWKYIQSMKNHKNCFKSI